jgi:hypothetical protein
MELLKEKNQKLAALSFFIPVGSKNKQNDSIYVCVSFMRLILTPFYPKAFFSD